MKALAIRRFRDVLVLLAIAAGSPSCCALFWSPPPPLESDLCTPERAYETFKKAVEQKNARVEFQCLSRKLRDEQGISWTKYQIGRDRVMASHEAEVKAFLASELRNVQYSPDRRTADLVLASPGRLGLVRLINEPEFVVTTDGPMNDEASVARFEGDLPAPAESLVQRTAAGMGIAVALAPDAEGWPASRPITEVIVHDQWRFLEILDLHGTPFPQGDDAGTAAPPKS
jgi:hypothetical protein